MPLQWPYARKKEQAPQAQGYRKDDEVVARTRTWLAYMVLLVCAIGIVVAAVTAIVAANKGDREAITRLVFVSVLPLFGTWVGTVLAIAGLRRRRTVGPAPHARVRVPARDT